MVSAFKAPQEKKKEAPQPEHRILPEQFEAKKKEFEGVRKRMGLDESQLRIALENNCVVFTIAGKGGEQARALNAGKLPKFDLADSNGPRNCFVSIVEEPKEPVRVNSFTGKRIPPAQIVINRAENELSIYQAWKDEKAKPEVPVPVKIASR